METATLKKFAQRARQTLTQEVRVKLEWVLKTDSAELRENEAALKALQSEIEKSSKEAVIEKAAYTWFNRLCALRFMDLKGFTRMGIVSPAEGQTQPEILAEAKMGHMDDRIRESGERVRGLLTGSIPSRDGEEEAYRLLLVAVCNDWHSRLPFLFERIADWTELLMPEDLLSEASLLHEMRAVLTEESCQNVEVIGWLYQFYISEKKDEVFEGLKKNKKIEAEDIPAATQLFTPNWIVRYLVENSLGRLWMLNNPESSLAEQMDYFIPDEPGQESQDFLKIESPTEIKICDPACGSGHMLVYAFELLAAIYKEKGFAPKEIPGLIFENNLVGIEIDPRAASLAAFALTMKACDTHKRFIKKPVQPNICVLKSIAFTEDELDSYTKAAGTDLFSHNLRLTLEQFADADHFGSLIRPMLEDPKWMAGHLEKTVGEDMFLRTTHRRVLEVLRQAEALATKYHVVVANPPYMGGKGMNAKLKSFAGKQYKDSKSDLFAMFSERIMEAILKGGFAGLMTPFTWMFLKSYEHLRGRILSEATLVGLVRPEYHAFFDSAYVPVCGWVIENQQSPEYKGAFIDLQDFYGANIQGPKTLEIIANYNRKLIEEKGQLSTLPSNFFRSSASDFQKIPGAPIAYWLSSTVRNVFDQMEPLKNFAPTKQGLATGDNDQFMRFWYEVDSKNISFKSSNRTEAISSRAKWFPCNKGGSFRKWYGNNNFIVNWQNDGELLKNFKDSSGKLRSRPQNQDFYFQEGLTWSSISSSQLSMRYSPVGHAFETKGAMCFPHDKKLLNLSLCYCNSKLVNHFLKAVSPTLDFHEGPVGRLPFNPNIAIPESIKSIIEAHKYDWDTSELSWNFSSLPCLKPQIHNQTLSNIFSEALETWNKRTNQIKHLEEENNRLFIEAYGLQAELTPEVPLNEITLTCNPHYRYGNNKTDKELEALLLADTMKEFISYSVGCMLGRYSLDKPGLILASQGETLEDYLAQVSEPTFMPDDDNVIPMLEEGWFTDDITERFFKFLKVTFGEAHFDENLAFLEDAIGKSVRKYFLNDFYTDHVKRYKKRPIYWMFESPKKSFKCLIYMHRYQPDTVSVILNNYLRDFHSKLSSRMEHLKSVEASVSASKSDKTKAIKEMDKIRKILLELETWERDVMFPMAGEQITIDLDDGVKVNYRKFDGALKKITGL